MEWIRRAHLAEERAHEGVGVAVVVALEREERLVGSELAVLGRLEHDPPCEVDGLYAMEPKRLLLLHDVAELREALGEWAHVRPLDGMDESERALPDARARHLCARLREAMAVSRRQTSMAGRYDRRGHRHRAMSTCSGTTRCGSRSP